MSAAAPRPPSADSGAPAPGAPAGNPAGAPGGNPAGNPAGNPGAAMLFRRGAEPAAGARGPRTPGGQFLRATATNDRAGAVPDEAGRAVFGRAFAAAVRRRFRPDTPLPAIAGSVAACARRHAEPTLPVREAEMLIREALGETVPTAGIAPAQRVTVHVLMFAALVDELALTDGELDELIAGAEETGAGEPEN